MSSSFVEVVQDLRNHPHYNLIMDCMKKYNFVTWNDEEQCVELFADHHILSSLRKCEAYFAESILQNTGRGRAWPLDFGIWLHSCVEYIYSQTVKRVTMWQKLGQITCPQSATEKWCQPDELVEYGAAVWAKMNIGGVHAGHEQYKKFSGFAGASRLLLQYWQMYGETRETLKIITTECSFGRSKEVYLGEFVQSGIVVRCYYAGRIDLIVDDGVSIGVMDTKTVSKFMGTELLDFKPHDGMEGYVYALRIIMQKYFADQNVRPCNRMIINHVQTQDANTPRERFKRTPITFSLEELEEWKSRQLRSFKKLYELAVLGETPDWNTELCSRWYFKSDCPFKELHRQSPSNRELIKKAHYQEREQWDWQKD